MFKSLNKGVIQTWFPTIVGIIIVLLIGGGILAWQYYKAPKEEVKAPEEEVKGGVEDETAGWKTYTNNTYKFSIKYPKDYTVEDKSNNTGKLFKRVTFNSNGDTIFILNIRLDWPMKNKDEDITKLTLDEILQEKIDQMSVSRTHPKTTLDGQPAYEAVDFGAVNDYLIFSKYNNHLYELDFDTGNKDTFQENKNALTQIQKDMLSTFQFIQ